MSNKKERNIVNKFIIYTDIYFTTILNQKVKKKSLYDLISD